MKSSGMDWPLFKLVNGRILTETGYEVNKDWPTFKTWEEANQYLIDNDIRGDLD